MTILEGPDGRPSFVVSQDQGKTFTGPTPTSPWTDVCLLFSNKHGGTRISGPLFFGFSDPVTMALLERMPGHISFNDFYQK
jgi:hypothetical protein